MRFAVIGCGVIGKHHARTLAELPEAELAAVVDTVPERADQLGSKYGVPAFHSVDEALRHPDVDAVAVCTPSGDHAGPAIEALRAGKHVVIEKPLDVTPDAVAAVAKEAAVSGRAVTVISQHRFDAAAQIAHAAVQDGKFGSLTSGGADIAWWRSQGYYDSGDWRGTWALDGGGVLMNQGIHSIDLLVWLLGQPTEVFAWTGTLAHERIEVEDTAVATIRFRSGALGVVRGTTAAYPGLTARIQVHGDHGSAVIDDDQLVYFHASDGATDAPAYGGGAGDNQAAQVLPTQAGGTAGGDPSALSDAHTAQYRDFLSAIAEGRPPLVTIEENTRTLEVIWAIYESARRGRPVAVGA